MSQICVNIDGRELQVYRGQTIVEAAKFHNIEIPTLCHNDLVKHYGSCGLCVVELENFPRLVRACSTEIQDGMVIKTSSDRILESRKTTLELLLSDHAGDCKAPCSLGCPGKVDVQGYVGLIANKQYDEALKLIKEELPFPASVGRVCPHPCQTACRRDLVEDSISIAWLKRYVADLDLDKEQPYLPEVKPATGKKVAIIGGGPSGLSAAWYLAKEGHNVEVFEAMPEFGGMLKYGIPLYRLPREVLLNEIKIVKALGVTLTPNRRIGQDVSLNHLRERFDAVYVAIGAWQSAKMGVPGQDLRGVIGGIDFLAKFSVNEPIQTGKRIAVIGGGNTAMDACRTAVRLGAEKVYAVYRRTKEDMPAVDVEILEAEEEGIDFRFLLSPLEVLDDGSGNVSGIRLQKMRVITDARGRRAVEAIPGEEEVIEVDSVIVSIGQKLKNDGLEELELNSWGNINANEVTFETNLEGVFAGGDATNNGASIAIEAINDGKLAAKVIQSYLEGAIKPVEKPYYVEKEMTENDFLHIPKASRSHMGHETPEVRKTNFEEVVHGFNEHETVSEASRCLECGCHDFFECQLIKNANVAKVEPQRFKGDFRQFEVSDPHPYIQRDVNKCILCGMCVRICDEVVGQSILGLVDRGFGSRVLPAMGDSLLDTECISCGQCVSVCPTGALIEKLPIAKAVPVKAKTTTTTCAGCSTGCQMTLESSGSMLMRALPIKNHTVNKGLLCSVGRFEFNRDNCGERLVMPYVKKGGEQVSASFKEAMLQVARRAQSIHLVHGANALGILVSDQMTLEEMHMIQDFGKRLLNTDQIYTLGSRESGLLPILGVDASTNTTDELETTSYILSFGLNTSKEHAILGLKMRKALAKGAKWIAIHEEAQKTDLWASQSLIMNDSEKFAIELLKAVISIQGEESCSDIIPEFLAARVKSAEVTPISLEIAEAYIKSPKSMIVFNETSVSTITEMAIALMAVVSGHIGSPRKGLLKVRRQVNTQGMVDLGIRMNSNEIETALKNGDIKGLLVFGLPVESDLLSQLEFLMVMDTKHSDVSAQADVVLPMAALNEVEGHVTSMDRRIQKVRAAVEPPSGKSNIEILRDIMNTYGKQCNWQSIDEIFFDICLKQPSYSGLQKHSQEPTRFWPSNTQRILTATEKTQ